MPTRSQPKAAARRLIYPYLWCGSIKYRRRSNEIEELCDVLARRYSFRSCLLFRKEQDDEAQNASDPALVKLWKPASAVCSLKPSSAILLLAMICFPWVVNRSSGHISFRKSARRLGPTIAFMRSLQGTLYKDTASQLQQQSQVELRDYAFVIDLSQNHWRDGLQISNFRHAAASSG